MAITGRVDVIGTVPTIVAREVLKYTMPNLEFWPRITHRFVTGGAGDRVQIPTYNDTSNAPPSAVQLHTGTASGFSGSVEPDTSGGAQLTYADQTIGSVTLFMANWYYLAMELSAYAEAVAQGDLVSLFREAGMDSLAVQMDTTVANLISGLSQSRGTLGNPTSPADINDCVALLDNGNVPAKPRHFIFSANEKANYFQQDVFTSSFTAGRTPISSGELGNFYGLNWCWTTLVPAPAAGQSRNVIMHEDAFAGAVAKKPMVAVKEGPDPQFTQRIVTMGIWAVNEIRDRFGVQLLGT